MSLDEELVRRLEAVRQGGRPEYHAKLGAEDKLFVRERLHRLLDPDSMVEEGALARCADDGNLRARRGLFGARRCHRRRRSTRHPLRDDRGP